MTQDGWAVQLGYSRATVKRWEAGEAVPSADAEAAILALCREKNLFRHVAQGLLTGVRVTPEWLADQLAAARLGTDQGSSPPLPARSTPPASTHYALSGDVAIAYQVFGSGPLDLVVTPGAVSHRELDWEHPGAVRFFDRLATFARVIIFDKRGTGMSDRVAAGTLEERMDDIRAVMDAAGVRRAALFGISEGGPMFHPVRRHLSGAHAVAGALRGLRECGRHGPSPVRCSARSVVAADRACAPDVGHTRLGLSSGVRAQRGR
ncbi:MAG: alpha/beta hydrolase [Chloroflexota bacterium]|nr:alpha/beta hydrolase [Chloroflexota bacterium]